MRPIDRFPIEVIDMPLKFQDRQWRAENSFDQLRKGYSLSITPRVREAISELKAEMGVSPINGITRDMIKQAKQFPITELIGASKKEGLFLCINHKEKRPSLWIKNNYAYCFGCHWHGDSIDVYMLLQRVPFKEAVRELCSTKKSNNSRLYPRFRKL